MLHWLLPYLLSSVEGCKAKERRRAKINSAKHPICGGALPAYNITTPSNPKPK
ncbi:hypothetical protein ACOSP7_013595 [Xanthoceras sorbifolium]